MIAALVLSTGCGAGLIKQYEYEEDIYLSVDGSATVYVNASLPSLAALRGLDVETHPRARLDRERLRSLYTTNVTRVKRVSAWRRAGRRFVQIRVELDDINRLSEAAPFSWSSYDTKRGADLIVHKQWVRGSANKPVGEVGWIGGELVAFRLHLPSKILFHNTTQDNFKRGNILVWEQTLADRLAGKTLAIEARMETTSILYRTLWLFAGSFLAAVVALGAAVLWVMRRGGKNGRKSEVRSQDSEGAA